jgi:hypothetical protein
MIEHLKEIFVFVMSDSGLACECSIDLSGFVKDNVCLALMAALRI